MARATRSRLWIPFAAGLASAGLLLAVLIWAGSASLRVETARFGEDRVSPWGAPPPVPAFPERVVTLEGYRGRLRTLHDSLSFFYSQSVRSRFRDVRRLADAARHRSLALNEKTLSYDADLISAFREDAREKGWTTVPELTVDGVAANVTLGLEQDGYVIFIVALADTFALVPGNPGGSMDVLGQIHDCPDDQKIRTPGLTPCDPGGFAPVWIWTNLPDSESAELELAPRARFPEGTNVWSEPWTWNTFRARATMADDG